MSGFVGADAGAASVDCSTFDGFAYDARAGRGTAGVSFAMRTAFSMSTLTTRLTPGSFIVTPTSAPANSIVTR